MATDGRNSVPIARPLVQSVKNNNCNQDFIQDLVSAAIAADASLGGVTTYHVRRNAHITTPGRSSGKLS